MIYYPLTTLMLGGIKDIAIISTPKDINKYENLLGDGSHWGIKLSYFIQEKPRGLSEAFIICKDFIGDDKVTLILGDNLFYGSMRLSKIFDSFIDGALIFGYPVKDPERFGVVEFDSDNKVLGIEEKPSDPKTNYAVPGLYLYDNNVVEYASQLKPSNRGELEITDLNVRYLNEGKLRVHKLNRGVSWLDTGTCDSLNDASFFVQSVEKRLSYKIGCPEEVSLRRGFISLSEFENVIQSLPNCDYKEYLKMVKNEYN